jgi:branched-subunit amino acid aminotransferase/4-amino-4-deoxychorismate lyase
MERSLRELGMAMPMGRAALKLIIRELARRNTLRDGFLYMPIGILILGIAFVRLFHQTNSHE